jgi:hypothetical protein
MMGWSRKSWLVPAAVLGLFLFAKCALPRPASKGVTLMRTPNGGIQPRILIDAQGAVHMIYFKGDVRSGDIFYVRRNAHGKDFTPPIRVNSQADSAIAIGTVRGPQIALGKNNRVHVVWMGSERAEPRGPSGSTPPLYARLNDAGTAFEPQRNIARFAGGPGGGLSVADDKLGGVCNVGYLLSCRPFPA